MKKILNFDKEINFPTMIGEITAISLDHSLKFTSSTDIEGSFFIKGKYKMTEATHIEESFDYNIPVDIVLTEKLEQDTCKVEIEDFQYDIISDDTLRCTIDVLVQGVEEIILEEKEDPLIPELPKNAIEEVIIETEELVRECDQEKTHDQTIDHDIGVILKKEQEDQLKKDHKLLKEHKKALEKKEEPNVLEEFFPKEEDKHEHIESIFSAFKDTEETFKSYSVYILRRNDTLDKIYDLYDVTYEELSEYNDLDHISVGMKIIIPTQKAMKHE